MILRIFKRIGERKIAIATDIRIDLAAGVSYIIPEYNIDHILSQIVIITDKLYDIIMVDL